MRKLLNQLIKIGTRRNALSQLRPKEFFGRRWLGLEFLRAVVNPGLDDAYERAFSFLVKLPTPVKVAMIQVILSVVGRITVIAWIKEHRVDGPKSSLVKGAAGIHSGEEALYTGGGIYLKEPLNLTDLGLAKNDETLDLRTKFWKWMEETGWVTLQRIAVEGAGGYSGSDTLRTLAHEYCHWRMTKRTTMATVVESVSWRVSLDEIMVCELLRRLTGLPMNLDHESVAEIRSRRDDFRQKLSHATGDPRVENLLLDLAHHHYFATVFYPTILSTLLEPTAFELVREKGVSDAQFLSDYFYDSGFVPYRYAERILQFTRDFLARNGNSKDARQKVFEAVGVSLNFPLRWDPLNHKLIGRSGPEAQEGLVRYLAGRYENYLKGDKLPVAREDESHMVDAIGYALWFRTGNTTSQAFTETMLNLIGMEPEFFNHILRRALRLLIEPTFEREVIVVNVATRIGTSSEVELQNLRYDTLVDNFQIRDGVATPVPWRTKAGRPLSRVDDVIGSVPPTLPTALTILRELDEIYRLAVAGNKQAFSEALKRAEQRGRIPVASLEIYSKYEHLLSGPLMDYVRGGLRYWELLSNKPGQLQTFLTFWLEFLSVMGEDAVRLAAEHGMSA